MQDSLARFVADLADADAGRLVNPYACYDPEHDRPDGAATRSANLLAYLESRRSPALLLVGEAAGYRGCRFSGIPFTSERCLPPEQWTSLHAKGWVEPSATTVHGVLSDLGLESRTLLWNAIPFHPSKDGRPLANRTPTAEELKAGRIWLRRLLGLTHPGLVVAIGRSAAASLGPEDRQVRHPSFGGASTFRQQLTAIVRERRLGS